MSFEDKDDEGIVKHTGYRKTSFRLNLDQKLTKFLDLALNANYVESSADPATRGAPSRDESSIETRVSDLKTTEEHVNLFAEISSHFAKLRFSKLKN